MATYWHNDGVLVLFPMDPETGRYRVIADIVFPMGDRSLNSRSSVFSKRSTIVARAV